MENVSEGPVTVYYDGRCPLCLREIGWLASRSRAGSLRLVDIHDDLAMACDEAPDAQRMLAILHARLPDGRWLTGVEATVAAWRAAGVGRRIGWLLWPPVRPVARVAYRLFARYRHTLARLLGERVCDADCRSAASTAVRQHFQGRDM